MAAGLFSMLSMGANALQTQQILLNIAGQNIANTGHHHVLIDLEELPSMELPLPKNENVVHFGGGQTETQLELAPGEHTLQLLLGDHAHIPHTPPVMSPKITITVE